MALPVFDAEIAQHVQLAGGLDAFGHQCSTDLTRKAESLELGISPRGALALFRSAQALALIEGRDYCIADDIKRLVLPCFAHRVIVSSRSSNLKNRTREAEKVLNDVLEKTAVPV